jgi:hypothetical protein
VQSSPLTPDANALELPDLDKADDGGEVDIGVVELSFGDELDVEEGEGTADGFELRIEEQNDAGSDEPAHELEIGIAELLDAVPEEAQLHEGDAVVPLEGELDVHLDTPLEADDTSTDAELGHDGLEALPELVEEDGDDDAGPELEGAMLPAAPEGAIPRGARLQAEWLLLGTPCSALWAEGDRVLASAEQLMRFGDERRSTPLPAGATATSLCMDATGAVVLATNRGLFELGASGGFVAVETPEPVRGHGAEMVQLSGSPNAATLWARLDSGALLRRRGAQWERHEAGGAVRALSTWQQQITLLVVAERPTLQVSTDGGSSFSERLLPEPAATVALGAAPIALSLGRVLALCEPERGLCVSDDDGLTFRMVTGAVNATAATLGHDRGKTRLFVALYREGRDETELIEVDPSTGAATLVAELSGDDDDDAEETGRTSALIVAGGSLWAAGGFGLVKLGNQPAA